MRAREKHYPLVWYLLISLVLVFIQTNYDTHDHMSLVDRLLFAQVLLRLRFESKHNTGNNTLTLPIYCVQ